MRLLSLLTVLTLAIAPSSFAGERYAYHGFAPAYPDPDQRSGFERQSRPVYPPYERLIATVIDIDTAGKVTSVAAENPTDSDFVRYAERWLRSIRFAAATFEGEPVVSRLPLVLQYRPKVHYPVARFPVDTNRLITNADLFFRAATMNGMVPPMLEEFPWYYCDLTPSDTSRVYKYVLLKISLGRSGEVEDVQEVASTYPAFTEQIKSAVLWAKFLPAEVHGEAAPSECFLLVSFFPQASYPTSVWRRDRLDSLAFLDRFRVRLLPDTVGLMAGPLPAKLNGDEYTLAGPHAGHVTTVTAMMRIDATGRVTVYRISKALDVLSDAIRQL
ncbi:MAG: hypothetical protein AB1744_15780, partial [Candidatus Zixiibacteriota bacterium]